MPTHLEESLQRDIEAISLKLREMGDLAERALQDCVQAIVEESRQVAYAVMLRDQFIDQLELEVDQRCLGFLVRQQPAASHLRFAYGCIRVNLELERVGDYAESIAHQFLKLNRVAAKVPTERFVQLANLSIPMLRDALTAFLEQDEALARRTMEIEETVDATKSSLNRDLVEIFRRDEIPFAALNPMMMIARRFERVSDQARNICREALYLATGKDTRHPRTDAFRVLFVDTHNATLGPMAEAIGNRMQLKEFIFSSAGIDPQPAPPIASEFMRSKGLDVDRMAPKAIHQIPDLDHYQVVISLSPDARRTFPKHLRKVICLDWIQRDTNEGTSPEDQQAILEEAFNSIQTHLTELTQAVLRS